MTLSNTLLAFSLGLALAAAPACSVQVSAAANATTLKAEGTHSVTCWSGGQRIFRSDITYFSHKSNSNVFIFVGTNRVRYQIAADCIITEK